MFFITLWIVMLVLGGGSIALCAWLDPRYDWVSNVFYFIACWLMIGMLLILPAPWAAACPDCPL